MAENILNKMMMGKANKADACNIQIAFQLAKFSNKWKILMTTNQDY